MPWAFLLSKICGVVLFTCKRENGFSLFKFNNKTILKKRFVSKDQEDSLLESLEMGYNIGSMDADSPIFQSTINKMKAEFDNTISEIKNELFPDDSEGE